MPLRSPIALLLILSVIVSPRLVRADDTALAYIPAAAEIARLLGALDVLPNESENDGWDASRGFAVAMTETRVFDLYASARILRSETEARRYFDDVAGAVSTENERTDARKSPEVARFLNATDALDVRLIYFDPDLRSRQSDYARLIQFGRIVVLIEAIGSPEFDDRNQVDLERERALNRLSEIIAGKVAFYAPDAPKAIPALTPFAKEWGRHGMSLSLDATGHGELTWRVYRWCQEDPTPPCDRLLGNVIDPGGGAAIAFLRIDGASAHGIVIGSTDPEVVSLGPIMITLREHGTLEMQQGGEPLRFCGPDFATLAPPHVLAAAPCGA